MLLFCTWRSSAISSSGRRSSTGLKVRFIHWNRFPFHKMSGNNNHLKRILSVILLKMLSPVVYGSFWKSEMVLQTTSVLVLCVTFMMNGNISFQCPPVTVKEWDKVKLREGLVERRSSFVGKHEEGVVAACASHAHKLPQSLQEVIWTWDGEKG